MEENISFERFLYEEGKPTPINDIEFLIDRIIMFPKIRPHSLERAVSLCFKILENIFLTKSSFY